MRRIFPVQLTVISCDGLLQQDFSVLRWSPRVAWSLHHTAPVVLCVCLWCRSTVTLELCVCVCVCVCVYVLQYTDAPEWMSSVAFVKCAVKESGTPPEFWGPRGKLPAWCSSPCGCSSSGRHAWPYTCACKTHTHTHEVQICSWSGWHALGRSLTCRTRV